MRLVEALFRHGSLGAAGRELLISQPAASNRLAALERRIGERLFDRDTTGARPTPAGRALAAEAAHVLEHLEAIFDRTRAAARAGTLTAGTFASLAPWLFPALEELLGEVTVHQVSDHGDRLAVLIPAEVRLGSGRKPFAGLDVIVYTYDTAAATLHRRVCELGGRPRRAATAETAVRMGRLLRCPVVLPRGLGTCYAEPQEQVSAMTLPGRLTLFMVTRRPTPPELTAAAAGLPARLGLEPASDPPAVS
ncbi:LysR family transcriptional regulator [Nonomuraea sp. NPDC050691]|uniref:LysR family transcriptional regulator n=1 Tax=Nonomuraea sp. NPDC050691 TaxID=3155661 RepID=UPI0033DDCEF9